MRLILDSMKLESGPFEIALEESAREMISENVAWLTFATRVENHFPAGVQLRFHFARTEEALFANDAIVIVADAIPAAPIDGNSGRVTGSEFHDWAATLGGDSLALFAEPNVIGGIEVTLAGDGDNPCEIWTTDYVTIRGMLSFRCRVQ
jgi:hypothetical protein